MQKSNQSSTRNAVIMAISVIDLLASVYVTDQDVFTLLIPPATAAGLMYLPINRPSGPLIRTLGAALAMAIFNSILLFGNDWTLSHRIPDGSSLPSMTQLTRMMPTALMVLTNLVASFAWWTSRQAVPSRVQRPDDGHTPR